MVGLDETLSSCLQLPQNDSLRSRSFAGPISLAWLRVDYVVLIVEEQPARVLWRLARRIVEAAWTEHRDVEIIGVARGEAGVAARIGRQAIDLLKVTPDVRMVLMDIMMPEMDGYQTMREIRSDPRFRTLPMLALTAKAMKGDREKCLQAGASDYIAKPVNTDQLLSLMRMWLYR